MNQSKGNGFSLVELLIVIVIVVLLAGLIFQVIVLAKREAKVSESIVHGRQISMAMQLYFESNGDYPETSLDSLVDSGFISTPLILKSQADETSGGFYSELLNCVTAGRVQTKYPQSYEYHYLGQPGSARSLRTELLLHDPESSLLALRSHGENLPGQISQGCQGYLLRKVGKIVRFRADG